MQLDAVILGGGAAGLWLLDEFSRRGLHALLLEARCLGAGQTIASQGIIHGGLKYTLQGLLTPSATAIREMPLLWKRSLAGEGMPDLRGTRLRADCCYLWRTDSVTSRVGMIGARFGLRVAPRTLRRHERPAILADCPGTVARLDEQVISTVDFVTMLSRRHHRHILKINAETGIQFHRDRSGGLRTISLTDPDSGQRLKLSPRQVICTAGAGNASLRQQMGLSTNVMQRRPLHMLMLRGPLPVLNGHCVDGARTRVTVTSDTDTTGRRVWQVGGHLAERGVRLDESALIDLGRRELAEVIPGLDLSDVEFATYRVDRAERAMSGGRRPESVQILRDANVITAWPTKLALVPQLVREIVAMCDPESGTTVQTRTADLSLPADWPRPRVALPPWETAENWSRGDRDFSVGQRAA